jgi:SHS2 domain-containing protein
VSSSEYLIAEGDKLHEQLHDLASCSPMSQLTDPVSGMAIDVLPQRLEFAQTDLKAMSVRGPSALSSSSSSSSSASAASGDDPVASTTMDVVVEVNHDEIKARPVADNVRWRYLPHTADIQLHSWGATLKEAFEGQIISMINYVTDLRYVDIKESKLITVNAHDMNSLLYAFMDEFLNEFNTHDMVCKRVTIKDMQTMGETFKIKALFEGEKFDSKKHQQGTEIKAITYSNMQILQNPHTDTNNDDVSANHDVDIYTIVDI